MANNNMSMDERMSKHERQFTSRFSSAMTQLAGEGIELTLPIVVVEHINKSENNLSVVRSQVRKCAKEDMPKKFEDDDYYFSLLKIKEVVRKVVEKGAEIEKKELMMILRCKMKSANYAIYHELNNRIEHKLRISVYVFDKEGCIYPDKTASKTPLNIALLREMFKVNKSIPRPKYVDNKTDRKRGIARQHAKERNDEGDFPKEIKMGEIFMPPYLWFASDESTPGPKRLVGEDNSNKSSTSRNARQESTPDLRQRGLVGEYNSTKPSTSAQQYSQDHIHSITTNSQLRNPFGEYIHSDLNVLLQTKSSQDLRSILIDESTVSNRRVVIEDEVNEKRNVFERLGKSTTEHKRTNSDASRPKEQNQQPTTSKNIYNQAMVHQHDQQRKNMNSANKQQRVDPRSTHYNSSHDQINKQSDHTHDHQTNKQHGKPRQGHSEKNYDRDYERRDQRNSRQQDKINIDYSKQKQGHQLDRQDRSCLNANRDIRSEQHNREYERDENNRHKDSLVPERYGRVEKGKDAHRRDTSRESRNSQNQNQESSVDFYNKWKSSNLQPNKLQHNQEKMAPAKRPHVENDKNIRSSHSQTTLPKKVNCAPKISETSQRSTSTTITNDSK